MAAARQKKPPAKKQFKRRKKALTASRLTGGLMTRAMRAKGFAQTEVVTRWPQIVGAELAAATLPVRLVFPRGERTEAKLVIRCESAFAPLLDHKREQVMAMVNSFFGYRAVGKLEVKQGPLKNRVRKPALEKKALGASDRKKLADLTGEENLSPLKQAVHSLGEIVLSHKK